MRRFLELFFFILLVIYTASRQPAQKRTGRTQCVTNEIIGWIATLRPFWRTVLELFHCPDFEFLTTMITFHVTYKMLYLR